MVKLMGRTVVVQKPLGRIEGCIDEYGAVEVLFLEDKPADGGELCIRFSGDGRHTPSEVLKDFCQALLGALKTV